MGWGAPFVKAFSAASAAAKSAAQKIASGVAKGYDKAREVASNAADWGKQRAEGAAKWAKQQASKAAEKARDLGHQAADTARSAAASARQAAKKATNKLKTALKKLKKKFSKKKAGSNVQSCPMLASGAGSGSGQGGSSSQSSEKPKALPPCCVRKLSVKCGHGGRKFVLRPPNTATNKDRDQIIQVIAEHADTETIAINFDAGPCNRGCGPDYPSLTFNGQRHRGSTSVKIHGPPPPPDGVVALPQFLYHFLSPKLRKAMVSYPGSVTACEGASDLSFEVQAFALRKWSGKISISGEFDVSPETVEYLDISDPDFQTRAARVYNTDKHGKLKATGELSGTYGSRTFKASAPTIELGREAGDQSSAIERFGFKSTAGFFVKVWPNLGKFLSSEFVKITPLWPAIELSGEWKTTEIEGKYNVSSEGKVNFGLQPLIGLSGTFEGMEWMIDKACYLFMPPPAAYALSKQLRKIKAKAEEGVGGNAGGVRFTCRMDFTASGKIGGGLEWEYKADDTRSGKGKIAGDLDIEVKGEISGEVRVKIRRFQVSYIAGVTASAESGVGGEISYTFKGEDPGFGGQLTFKGLTIKATKLTGVGGSEIGNKPVGQALVDLRKQQEKGRTNWLTGKLESSDVTFEMVILEEAKWPKDKDAALADGAG